MSDIEFLKFGPSQIRHQIKEIITSYSHSWDILAEIIQNSVDAVKKAKPTKGHLKITLDKANKKLVVEDNGCGISNDDLPLLLAPFSSSKVDDPESVGEKGVGITFVLFSSVSFSIVSRTGSQSTAYNLEGAAGWLASNSEVMPRLSRINEEIDQVGTRVTIGLPSDHPILSFSFSEINFVLRTKTAIGDTASVFGLDPFNCDYLLTVIDEVGNYETKEAECHYLLPTELLQASNFADLDNYREWRRDADRSDAQKRNFWRDKAVVGKGAVTKDGRQIRYWYFFVPRRTWWTELNKAAGLPLLEEDDEGVEANSIGFSGGMQLSTKFTPSGISSELRPRGSAGYVPNFMCLIDDPKLKLDIGRKSVAQPKISSLAAVAYTGFRGILNDVQKYTSGAPEFQTEFDKDEAFTAIDSMPDLHADGTCFVKRPNGQEAVISAMFFESIGRKRLTGYQLLSSGYKGKYDLFARKGSSRYVIEFKFDLKGLLKDFRDEKKLFSEVNIVVLWEVTEVDRTEAMRRGLDIVENTTPPGKTNKFPEAQLKLCFSVGVVQEIWIIEMKKVLGL